MAISNIDTVLSSIPNAGKRGIDTRDDFVLKQEAFQDALSGAFGVDNGGLVYEFNLAITEMNQVVSEINTTHIDISIREDAISPHYDAIDRLSEPTVLSDVDAVAGKIDEVGAVGNDVLKGAGSNTPSDSAILNALTNANSASTSKTETELAEWEAKAAKQTSSNYAVTPVNIYVDEVTSNGDGTFTSTTTSDYSALHHKIKAEEAAAGVNLPSVSAGDAGDLIQVNAAGTGYELIDLNANGYTKRNVQEVITESWEFSNTTSSVSSTSGAITVAGGVGVVGNLNVGGTFNGRDINTDGSKLDGIEAGATADQSASEILTAIKTVDGQGSGLDADLLDGLDSSQLLRSDTDGTVSGNLNVTGSVSIAGDMTVSGVLTTVETATITTSDNIIILNDGEVGAGVTSGEAGIEIDRGTEVNAKLIYDETTDVFRIGDLNSTQRIATLTDSPVDGIGVYDTATQKFTPTQDITLNTTTASRFLSGNSDTIGGAIRLSGTSGAMVLDADGNKAITWNDGYSNLAIESGTRNNNYVASGGFDSGAAKLQLTSDNFTGVAELKVAPIGAAGGAVAWGNTLKVHAADGLLYNNGKIWHEGNDGSGSGLDADKIDGVEGSQLLRNDTSGTISGSLSVGTAMVLSNDNDIAVSPDIKFDSYGLMSAASSMYFNIDGANLSTTQKFSWRNNAHTSAASEMMRLSEEGNLTITNGEIIAVGDNQARFKRGDDVSGVGVIHRNDNSDYYILLTNQDDADGSWNTLRPFKIDLTTGAVQSDNGFISNGLLKANGDIEISNTSPEINFNDTTGSGGGRIVAADSAIWLQGQKSDGSNNGDVYISGGYEDNANNIYVRGPLNTNDTVSEVLTHSVTDEAKVMHKLDFNLLGSDPLTASRSNVALDIDVDSSVASGDTTNEHRVYGIQNNVNVTGDSDLVYGLQNVTRANQPVGDITYLRGQYNYTQADNIGGTIGSATASYNLCYEAEAGVATDLSGVYSAIVKQETSTATTNTHTGLYSRIQVQEGAGTVSTGFAIRAVVDNNKLSSLDPAYNTGYLFYGSYEGFMPATAYGIYIASTVDNYFAGDIKTSGRLETDSLQCATGQQLVINAGESFGKIDNQVNENIYLNAEAGISINTPDSDHPNWDAGYTVKTTKITGYSMTIDGHTVWHSGNDGAGSGLDADMLDGANSTSYLNAAQTSVGNYSTSGNIEAGRGSGGPALTINDGYGDSNLSFNHANGSPEQNGNAARITMNTDSSTNAEISFGVKSGVTAGASVAIPSTFSVKENSVEIATALNVTGQLNGRDLDVDSTKLDDLGTLTDMLVTVGTGGDFSTVNEALASVSAMFPAYKASGVQIEIQLLAGFVMAEQVIVDSIDLGYITITGADAETTVQRDTLTTEISFKIPLFAATNGGTLPKIGQLFSMDSSGSGTYMGVYVADLASATILPDCGVKNVSGGYGIYGHNGATCLADSAIFSGCNHGIYAMDKMQITAREIDLSNSETNGVYMFRQSEANLYGANISNAGAYAISISGATCSAEYATLSYATYGAIAASYGATVLATMAVCSNTSIGISAETGSTVHARSVNCTNTTTSSIKAYMNSTVYADYANCSGNSTAYEVYYGSTIGAQFPQGDSTTSQTINTISANGIIYG